MKERLWRWHTGATWVFVGALLTATGVYPHRPYPRTQINDPVWRLKRTIHFANNLGRKMRKDNNRYTRVGDALRPPVRRRTEVVLVVLDAEMRN